MDNLCASCGSEGQNGQTQYLVFQSGADCSLLKHSGPVAVLFRGNLNKDTTVSRLPVTGGMRIKPPLCQQRSILKENSVDNAPRVMIVEDDERLATLTSDYLSANGLSVTVVSNGNEAIRRIPAEQPDIVVLDLMLPGADGLTVCREVRRQYRNPILMLTARTDDMDQILGLEMGADDYVAKPVKPRLLLARVRALLRRIEPDAESPPSRLEFGNLVIDNSAREVILDGQSVEMTSAEYDLLWLLASHAGTVLSRETIFERLRGIQYDGQDRSIDVRISRIRPKVGDDPDNPRRIKTVRSKGYLFVADINAG